MNVWTRVGPDGGSIHSLEYLGSSDSVVLAATGRGIYRSEDNAQSWRRVFAYPHTHNGVAPIAIAVNPANPQQVLMISSNIFRSSDGGNTWDFAPTRSPPRGTPTSIAFSRDGGVAWLGTDAGEIFRSTDAGGSWEARNNGLRTMPVNRVSGIQVDAADPNVAYATFTDRVSYRTTDGGATWAPLPGTYWELTASPVTPGALLATSVEYPFKSADYGDTWRQIGLPRFYEIEYSPDTPGVAVALFQGNHVSRTFDGGFMWINSGGGLPIQSGSVIAIQPGDTARFLIGSQLGIQGTFDRGVTYSESTAGIKEATFLNLVVAQDGSDLIYAPGYDAEAVYRRDPATGQWLGVARASAQAVREPGPLHYAITAVPGDANVVYMARNGRIGRSDDAGVTWTQLASVNADSLSFDPQDPQIGYAASYSSGIHKTTDGGAFWATINTGLTATSISEVLIDPTDSNVLYAASRFDFMGVFKSTDGGEHWAPANTGIETQAVFSMVFEPGNPAVLYAATGTGVFKSVNAGGSWVNSYTELAGGVVDIAIDPIVPSNVHAIDGAQGRVLRSVDAGTTWEVIFRPLLENGTRGSSLALLPSRPNVIIAAIIPDGLYETEVAPDLRLSSSLPILTAKTQQSVLLSVQNAGPYAASRVRFVATLPAADGEYSVQASKGSCAVMNQQATCELGALQKDSVADVTVAFTPSAAGSSLTASVSAHETDPATDNNSVSIPTQQRVDPPAPGPGGGGNTGGEGGGGGSSGGGSNGGGGSSGGGGGGSIGWLLLAALGLISRNARRSK
ncbi:hypothetical protein JM946_21860 [Steroidobacter sp. S1-65]|uniref:DUF11 domain-containing protein n=1 Tax=Steroidobacter gossypii TaxID=2805490 RepID=A0ABS1X2D5_9GAMM|nr:DUF11 domain-containing protein [Steroidobacter gossypii]MBM0107394.1 hypothetical protein [Steroidobacter gossypii]